MNKKEHIMKTGSRGVLKGVHKLSGNEAIVEGAFSAGCRFLGTFPIMPALETVNRYLDRCGDIGATFVQMEDEISALATVIGASWTGKKAMTVTSGSGLSNMMEHIGLGIMLQTPCVIVDVQRAGPSLGSPAVASQSDMMQSRWGSHGDYEVIALAPNSPQECFDLTIKAFNLSEKYRLPVFIMTDGFIAQQVEKINIPDPETIKIEYRKLFDGPKDKYLPYKEEKDLIPKMVIMGQGYRFHVTGLTHDQRGYPVMNSDCQEFCVRPLLEKITNNIDKISMIEEENIKKSDTVIISYGATSRIVKEVLLKAKKKGSNIGSLRLITVWPFPEDKIGTLAKDSKTLIVCEMNQGQIYYEVDRCARGNCDVEFFPVDGSSLGNIGKLADRLINKIRS